MTYCKGRTGSTASGDATTRPVSEKVEKRVAEFGGDRDILGGVHVRIRALTMIVVGEVEKTVTERMNERDRGSVQRVEFEGIVRELVASLPPAHARLLAVRPNGYVRGPLASARRRNSSRSCFRPAAGRRSTGCPGRCWAELWYPADRSAGRNSRSTPGNPCWDTPDTMSRGCRTPGSSTHRLHRRFRVESSRCTARINNVVLANEVRSSPVQICWLLKMCVPGYQKFALIALPTRLE